MCALGIKRLICNDDRPMVRRTLKVKMSAKRDAAVKMHTLAEKFTERQIIIPLSSYYDERAHLVCNQPESVNREKTPSSF